MPQITRIARRGQTWVEGRTIGGAERSSGAWTESPDAMNQKSWLLIAKI
jgi:hypothetical protein